MAECQNQCLMEERIKQLELKAEHNSDQHSIFYDRLRALDLSNQKNEMENKNIMEKLEDISSDVKASKKDIEELKDKPSERTEKFSSAIISSIGSAIGVGILALIAYAILNGMP